MNRGGAAFPSPVFAVPLDVSDADIKVLMAQGGMSLRTYIAIKAMQGIMGNDQLLRAAMEKDQSLFGSERIVAKLAFDQADAMIDELERK